MHMLIRSEASYVYMGRNGVRPVQNTGLKGKKRSYMRRPIVLVLLVLLLIAPFTVLAQTSEPPPPVPT